MNTKDLLRLKSWLEVRMQAIDDAALTNASDEYSEANLSYEILNYLKHCIDKEVQLEQRAEQERTRWYPDPAYPDPYCPTYPNVDVADTTTLEVLYSNNTRKKQR
jgi:hypothetical protein